MKLKYLTIFFFIALIIIILTPSLAQAGVVVEKGPSWDWFWSWTGWGLDKIAAGFVTGFTYIFSNIAAFIVGWVLRFSSLFLEWTINPGIGSITGQPFVVSGVLVTRSIANLVLIAILLIISIATIIGIESYGIRKALPMLIGVALLINFSSVITGLVIDAGQVPLEFFTEKAFPSDFSIGKAFQKSLHLDDISISNFNITGEGESFTTANVASNFIISLIMIFVGLMASFMFLKLGILLLLRYVAFWILTILAPFVFAISVFPSTRKYLTKWFTHLLEWSFLGVIATFFIYLALLVLVSFDISSEAIFKEKIEKGGGFMGNFGITLISLFTVYFFLQYGYNISKKMAGEGAMAIVNGVGNLIKSGAMAATAGLGASALLGKVALKRGIGAFVRQKPGETKSATERGQDKLRSAGAYLQTNRILSRIGGNRVGQFMMGEQGFTEKELKEIAAKKTAWKIRIENIKNDNSLTNDQRKVKITKLLNSSTLKRTDKAALSYSAIDQKLLDNKGLVLASKLAKLDEKLDTKIQEKYGHIVNAIDSAGNIDVKKAIKNLDERRHDISKLDLTTLDLTNDTHEKLMDNILMKIDGNTLSDMSTRNSESAKKVQDRIDEIVKLNAIGVPIISTIVALTGKKDTEVRKNINLINTQNTLMGATIRYRKEVQDKLTRTGGVV
ncbi:MAG: type IV secretion system protein [Patescibacteria group bacterium]